MSYFIFQVTHRELLQGFVECLENDEEETNPSENQGNFFFFFFFFINYIAVELNL